MIDPSQSDCDYQLKIWLRQQGRPPSSLASRTTVSIGHTATHGPGKDGRSNTTRGSSLSPSSYWSSKGISRSFRQRHCSSNGNFSRRHARITHAWSWQTHGNTRYTQRIQTALTRLRPNGLIKTRSTLQ